MVVKIFLAGYPVHETDPVARGYYTFADGIERWLRGSEHELTDGPTGADIALHLCPPHMFQPTQGIRNVCFTMWEAPILPVEYPPILSKADAIVVPSEACRKAFVKAGLQNVHSVPLAADEIYHIQDPSRQILRGPGSNALRFLYVGSMSPRKGAHLLAPAWRLAFEGRHEFAPQLYMKGIGPEGQRSLMTPYGDDRVVVDTRDISREALATLYAQADVFIFPSFGEGFGLPAIEAMATGCLVVATDAGGLSEFVSGYTAIVVRRPVKAEVTYGIRYLESVPTAESLALAMRQAYDNWGSSNIEALRNSGVKKARSFTWDHTGNSVAQILEGVLNENIVQTA